MTRTLRSSLGTIALILCSVIPNSENTENIGEQMNEVIDVDFKMLWNAPVYVAVGDRFASLVRGPEDAIHFLSVRWPSERSMSYARAMEKCLAAVSHRIAVEVAREAFVMACLDAHLTPDGGD
jgi:hypothetical protein